MEQRAPASEELPVWGRSVWQLNLDVLGAVCGVLTRRFVFRQPKVASWSVGYELRVDLVKALISGAVTKQDVELLRSGSAEGRRAVLDKMTKLQQAVNSGGMPMRPGCQMQRVKARGMEAAWVIPPGSSAGRRLLDDEGAAGVVGPPAGAGRGCRVVLYLHGGAYVVCGVQSHQRLMSSVATASGLPLLGVEYRLMPHVGFSEILEDAVRAFRCLVDDHGVLPGDIALAGDSAGGHLALALAAHLCSESPYQAPGAVYAMSPWLDPVNAASLQGGQGWERNAGFDYLGSSLEGAELAALGFKGHLYSSLLAPEVIGAVPKLPPILLQVGGHECLHGQAVHFAETCRAAGAENVWLEVYEEQVHVFQMFDDATDMADAALSVAGDFIRTGGGSHEARGPGGGCEVIREAPSSRRSREQKQRQRQQGGMLCGTDPDASAAAVACANPLRHFSAC